MELNTTSKNEVTGADLILPGSVASRVKVLKLYAHGVILERASLPTKIRDGINVKIGLCIPPGNLDGYMRVKGMVILNTQHAEVRFAANLPSRFTGVLNEYLQQQTFKNKIIADLETQQNEQRNRVNTVLRKAMSVDIINLLANVLNQIATGLEMRGERAGNDFERRIAIDDAIMLRRVCSQNSELLNLSNELLMLMTIEALANSALNVITIKHTDVLLNTQTVIDQLNQQLKIPLQQISYQLEELRVGKVSPPCSPAIIVSVLDKIFADFEFSMESRIYGLRCIRDFIQPLNQIYQKILTVLNTLS